MNLVSHSDSDRMGLATTLYRTVLNRTSSTIVVVMVGALFYERGVSIISDAVFDSVNKGVGIEMHLN